MAVRLRDRRADRRAAIGACTFTVTDSFWFNAVEAEVYALSMLFTALVVWLTMRWADAARREEARLQGGGRGGGRGSIFGLASNRYLVLIAYLFGLAIGVHLLNLLALFFVALIIFFTEYDRAEWSDVKRWGAIVATGLAASVAFVFVYPGVVQMLPTFAEQSGWPLFFFLVVFAALAFAVYYTHTRGMQRANLLALCATMILIGYSAYALIFIRSDADPPIDENDPETATAFIDYLKREQYGSTPLLSGTTFNEEEGRMGQEETLFPRRHSPSRRHQRVYKRYDSDWEFFWQYQVGHMYVRYFLWNFMGREGDTQGSGTAFGPEAAAPSATQAALQTGGGGPGDSSSAGKTTSGNEPPSAPASFETPSEEDAYNYYFALPLLLGLFGMTYHFLRDWRRAFSVGILFLLTGFGVVVYLNQTPMQPRERDYSYVGSFFAFSLWVGIGAAGLIELAGHALRDRFSGGLTGVKGRGALFGLGGLLFLAVPGWMAIQNYDDHDRSGRYIAPDYAYNMLNSVAEDAILFTNGDNDTFPLWYLQEVEGVRRDVRVVNLSLLNTPWYIKQLKNQPSRQSEPLPISMSEDRIDRLAEMGYRDMLWEPDSVQVPVDKSAYLEDVGFTSLKRRQIHSPMAWKLTGRSTPYEGYSLLIAADRVAYNLIRNNAENGWKRPIYFATTVSQDARLDLGDYLQIEGLALRVTPIRHQESLGRVTPLTAERMSDFRFRGLNDPDVYYDNVTRRLIDAYRLWFSEAALQLSRKGRPEMARSLVDTLSQNIPFDVIPSDTRMRMRVARAHAATGDTSQALSLLRRTEKRASGKARLSIAQTYARMGRSQEALRLAQQAEDSVLRGLRQAGSNRRRFQQAARQVQTLRYLYMQAGAFDEAAAFSEALAQATGDPSLAQSAGELRSTFQGRPAASGGAGGASAPPADSARPPAQPPGPGAPPTAPIQN
ncbi:MAG: DUF2723 domain-containing protein [Bacteroidetes bacterium QS_8_68_15]|nr:MAG: DUF2723 domain-containing protein [Bacteroidetes bacterium QS_8_68_15]